MEKIVGLIMKKAYYVLFAVLGILALFYICAYRLDMTKEMQHGSFVKASTEDLSEYAYGDNKRVRVRLGDISGEECHLIFYSIHKQVTVFYGPSRIYAMGARNDSFSKTPGCVWNDILLTEDMSHSDLIINLTPVYKGLSYKVPDFYVGTRSSIIAKIIGEQIFMLIICVILVIMGCTMMTFIIYNRKNTEVDKNLFWLGTFTFYIGIWKIVDSSAAKLFFQGLPVISLLPFISLGMMAVPFLLYICELHSSKDEKIWLLPCFFSLGVIFISEFLQFFRLVDFRQMLVWFWTSLVFGGIVMVYMVVREYRFNHWSKKLRRNLFGMILVTAGLILDLISYVVNGGRNIPGFSVFFYMIFIILQGFFVFKESGALIVAGDGVLKMENYAYHDKLTGLFNRAAFITDTDPYAVNPESYAVVVMDLNDLKKCNDTLGHEMGDKYISDSAKIIQETFGSIGNCYRMGGDEFYCLIPKGGKKACSEQENRMEEMIKQYNAASPELKISIAVGVARYDQRMDYDLNATAKRADKAMYQRKEKMKEEMKKMMQNETGV